MPFHRPPRPRRPKPTPDELERRRLQRSAQWLHAQRMAWRDAMVAESWRLTYAEGRRACGRAEFDRGARSLMDQGVKPPPGWETLL
jgi:hypothetical protein